MSKKQTTKSLVEEYAKHHLKRKANDELAQDTNMTTKGPTLKSLLEESAKHRYTLAGTNGMRVGYKRVSSVDQNPERQLAGLEFDKTFEDRVSGSTIKRPQLQACLDYLREGDTLYVHSIDRLARNLPDLLNIIRQLLDKKVSVKFINENLSFNAGAEENPFQKLQLQIIGSVAEFERSLIKERQREGIEKAKRAGKHLGRPRKMTPALKDRVLDLLERGTPQAEIARQLKINRQAVYRVAKESRSGRDA